MLLVIILEVKNAFVYLLTCAFCKSAAKKKKSLGRILKISFVETLGSCNWLSTTSQSERMTFHLNPEKSTLEKEVP